MLDPRCWLDVIVTIVFAVLTSYLKNHFQAWLNACPNLSEGLNASWGYDDVLLRD